MTNGKLGVALVGGYFLGRTKKAKVAIGLGMFLAGKKLSLDPQQLGKMLANSPVLSGLSDQVRKELVGATKSAATAALTNRANSLADSLSDRTLELKEGGGRTRDDGRADDRGDDLEEDRADDGANGREDDRAEHSYESEPDEAVRDDEARDDGERQERPRRKEAPSRPRKTASSSTARKTASSGGRKAAGTARKTTSGAAKKASRTRGSRNE
ncbi:hypothetical protein ABZW18_01805 [Streptomyces sp. NPDC004647]|uniref:hypothetical protein n=1 Tax=Streptomyces sp. NPDC004647 TaxID=3154671 RepID=UPI0033AF8EFF